MGKSKSEKRRHIKRLYPLACAGDVQAIQDLAKLMKGGRAAKSTCEICGVPVIGKRCMAHVQRRVYMRRRLETVNAC